MVYHPFPLPTNEISYQCLCCERKKDYKKRRLHFHSLSSAQFTNHIHKLNTLLPKQKVVYNTYHVWRQKHFFLHSCRMQVKHNQDPECLKETPFCRNMMIKNINHRLKHATSFTLEWLILTVDGSIAKQSADRSKHIVSSDQLIYFIIILNLHTNHFIKWL